MPLFPASFIDDLKSHADIVQVVQERVPLRRAGTSWKGLCPFHGEKTPSFNVHGDQGYFKCFGCGVGGDVIKFVELYEKLSFPEAVRQLASRFMHNRFDHGHSRHGDTHLFISRGLGVVTLPWRYKCPPEVCQIDLVPLAA